MESMIVAGHEELAAIVINLTPQQAANAAKVAA